MLLMEIISGLLTLQVYLNQRGALSNFLVYCDFCEEKVEDSEEHIIVFCSALLDPPCNDL